MTVESIDPVSTAVLGAIGLAIGWAAWLASIRLLGFWGVPDALLARRSLRKGEYPMRLVICECENTPDRALAFRWRPENNPVMSPSLSYLHHLVIAALLAGIASVALRISGISTGNFATLWLLFVFSLVILIPLAWRGFHCLKEAQRRYEESASKTFSRIYPLDDFNSQELLNQLQALKIAATHIPGGFHHVQKNFLDYIAQEAGKSFLSAENKTTLLKRLSDVLVQAEIDMQTIVFLDACFADVYPALSVETRQAGAQSNCGFAVYAAAFEAKDAERLVTAIFHEPGVTYIRKAKDAMEKMFREVQKLRLVEDIASSRLAAQAQGPDTLSWQSPIVAAKAAVPAAG